MLSRFNIGKIYYGWLIVGIGCLVSLYTAGVIHLGFTTIFEPIADEFGWSYAQISLASSLRGLEAGLLAPLMGMVADRWNPRYVMYAGLVIAGLGLLLFSSINSLGMLYVSSMIIALGTGAVTGPVYFKLVSNWFRKRITLAIGIVSCGFALGGLMLPLLTHLISLYGWRTTMLVFGVGMLVVLLPLTFLVRNKPDQSGYPDADGKEGKYSEGSVDRQSIQSLDIREEVTYKNILKSRVFWHIGIASFIYLFLVNAVMVHIMPYLSSVGLTRSVSSFFASAVPLASISGRLGFGWLGGKFNEKKLLNITWVLFIIGLVSYVYVSDRTTWAMIPFMVFYGIGWGGNMVLTVALVRKHFDARRFGTAYGFVMGICFLGGVISAPLAGLVYDTWGAYQGMWLGLIGMAVLGIVAIVTIPEPKKQI